MRRVTTARGKARFAAAAALIVAAWGFGCKGGSDLETPMIGVTAGFVPDPPTVSSAFVSLQQSVQSGGRITLDVVVTDVVEPVSGIALKIAFPGNIAKFDRCLDGDLFAPGTCYVSQAGLGADEVFIGRSIVAPESPVSVSGSRTIVRIEFVVYGFGAGDIVFEAQNLGGGDASALLDANGDPILVTWFAGSLTGM
jgi:hypothetical protein